MTFPVTVSPSVHLTPIVKYILCISGLECKTNIKTTNNQFIFDFIFSKQSFLILIKDFRTVRKKIIAKTVSESFSVLVQYLTVCQ